MFVLKKPIDLNALICSYNNLPEGTFNEWKTLCQFSIGDKEIVHIEQLLNELKVYDRHLNYFYVGYTIPQIGKEFDLLRFGEEYILNVEVKAINKNDDVREQLVKNKYYLSALNKELHLFTYIAEDSKLYKLDGDDSLISVEMEVLEGLIEKQKIEHLVNIDNLFNPSDYLVSPFNSVDKFCNGNYFLNQQQEKYKTSLLKSPSMFHVIEGNAGTGKTLMLYDLAKHFKKEKNVVVIHSGDLNSGHIKLVREYGWRILPAKNYLEIDSIKPDAIFIDETQRMFPNQLKYIIEYIQSENLVGIFAIDPLQILSVRERQFKNREILLQLPSVELYKLTTKVRTNMELADFTTGLFDLYKMRACKNTDNIAVHYFSEIQKARSYSVGLASEGWEIIDYTSQMYKGHIIENMRLNRGFNAHEVLGQEFDKVVVVIGPSYYYNHLNKLTIDGATHYDPERMFYQSVTRARKKLMLLIVNNPTFMSKLMRALQY